MNRDICFRYGARILDLKKEGWEIENEPVPETRRQVWRCRLLKPYNEKTITKTKIENGVREHNNETNIGREPEMRVLQSTSDNGTSLHSPSQEQLFTL